MSLSILIADDHDIIRAGIRNILLGQPGYKIIGEATDGEQALAKTKELKPDILLLDISMPRKSGLDIIEQVHRVCPKTKVIIISVHKASSYIMKAIKAGVAGYLHKEKAAEDLLPALRKIAHGQIYLASSISSYLVEKALEKSKKAKTPKETLLTSREQEILRLVAEGRTAREIAQTLYISRRTVENYKNSIMEKLGLHKTSDLIKFAIKHKLVDIEEY